MAQQIVKSNDQKSIEELINLLHSKDKNIQSDCIKVLYEIGAEKPELISKYSKQFTELLKSKNNRLVWCAMTAFDTITEVVPKEVYEILPNILEAGDKGSVISKDHAVNILIKLSKHKQYSDNCILLLIDELKSCPTNQLPMYAENAMSVIDSKHKSQFVKLLASRLNEIEKESKRKRIEKVLKKLA